MTWKQHWSFSRRPSFSAIIVHRGSDADTLPIVEAFRVTEIPLIVVSGRRQDPKRYWPPAPAGFVSYDAWLRIGTVVGLAPRRVRDKKNRDWPARCPKFLPRASLIIILRGMTHIENSIIKSLAELTKAMTEIGKNSGKSGQLHGSSCAQPGERKEKLELLGLAEKSWLQQQRLQDIAVKLGNL